MAKLRRKVPHRLRLELVAEAGNKCANPGCPTRRTEIHHLRQWAVYQSHDKSEMVAICPSCHDAVHNGELPLSDHTLKTWKRLSRSAVVRDYVWVEPAAPAKLLLGTLAVESADPVTIFELASNNRLALRVAGGDIVLTSLTVSSLHGEEVVRVEDNHLRHVPRSDVSFKRIPGRVDVYVPANEAFIPRWALEQKRREDRFFGIGDRIKYLGLKVEEPGLLRVEGVWASDQRVVIISHASLSFCSPHQQRPLSMIGEGATSVLKWAGPLTAAMFGI